MTKVTAPTLSAQTFLNLATAQKRMEEVNVPMLNAPANVLVMSLGQREEMQKRYNEFKKNLDQHVSFSSILLQATVCDASGDLVLSSLSPQQIDEIPYSVLEPLLDKALKINGFMAEAVESARKN